MARLPFKLPLVGRDFPDCGPHGQRKAVCNGIRP